ncbi:response regulator transcription factor [Chitinophaga pendula]|uniref:response regulator transcription factor n=1 Tax=Chitinophaga TaxID=79328 RepID=UPI000BB0C9DB|nr:MULTISPECIES: response regulator transcription factor [Chitinophaga]ASZ13680.1 DNA-binding response regulator [Chitinophaga sp. MD30]UCJ08703.1 response regulator transcription factor [Chitinophaga pendula]
MPHPKINLAILDNQTLFRKMLKNYLLEHTMIRIVAQAPDLLDLRVKLKDADVDILLTDVNLTTLGGIELVKMIRREFPQVRILILSMVADLELINEMMEAGIHGYVTKTEEPEELIKAIMTVSEGRIYRNRLFTEALYWGKQHHLRSGINGLDVPLSEREKRVLQLIWEEKSNKEIGEQLFLGVRSIEKIRQDLKVKLKVGSTVGMLKYAINKGIVAAGRDSFMIR